jgi:hypothetical protein
MASCGISTTSNRLRRWRHRPPNSQSSAFAAAGFSSIYLLCAIERRIGSDESDAIHGAAKYFESLCNVLLKKLLIKYKIIFVNKDTAMKRFFILLVGFTLFVNSVVFSDEETQETKTGIGWLSIGANWGNYFDFGTDLGNFYSGASGVNFSGYSFLDHKDIIGFFFNYGSFFL